MKRKNGLLKKAMELGILCDCEVGVVIFNLNNGKLFEYSSVEAEKIFTRYATYNGPSERRKKKTVCRTRCHRQYRASPHQDGASCTDDSSATLCVSFACSFSSSLPRRARPIFRKTNRRYRVQRWRRRRRLNGGLAQSTRRKARHKWSRTHRARFTSEKTCPRGPTRRGLRATRSRGEG